MERLRVIFMGTADLACATLRALHQREDLDVVAVVSQPDKPKGRDLKLQPTPVKAVAQAANLAVLQPARARNEVFIQQLRELRPDLIVVAAYGQILPQSLLDVPRFGCLNVHTSLLPKYRGAAPIQWAILDDEPETGVTIMKMDAGLDTGPMLATARTPIAPTDNAQTLHDRLADLGARLLVETIPGYIAGSIVPQPQPSDGASYARKITKDDGLIDWTQPARVLWNRVRAFTPWPGAYTFEPGPPHENRVRGPWPGVHSSEPTPPKARLLKLWLAEIEVNASGFPGEILQSGKDGIVVACGTQGLRVLELQREGGRRLIARDFLTGHAVQPGERWGDWGRE
jgi:methionyl-tRNA formyltransferase